MGFRRLEYRVKQKSCHGHQRRDPIPVNRLSAHDVALTRRNYRVQRAGIEVGWVELKGEEMPYFGALTVFNALIWCNFYRNSNDTEPKTFPSANGASSRARRALASPPKPTGKITSGFIRPLR